MQLAIVAGSRSGDPRLASEVIMQIKIRKCDLFQYMYSEMGRGNQEVSARISIIRETGECHRGHRFMGLTYGINGARRNRSSRPKKGHCKLFGAQLRNHFQMRTKAKFH